MTKYLHIGGLVAVGFDSSGSHLLAVTHSGRGVFDTKTWERVARDSALAYPDNGYCIGIGPIAGQAIKVAEMDSERPLEITAPDGATSLYCESSGIQVTAP